MSATALVSPGLRIGHYELVSRLGSGGMGDVYLARDTCLQRDVAVKTLPLAFSANPDRLGRFLREAKILASLNHPNIRSIYGMEELPSGERFLILELVEGETLADRLARGPMPLPLAIQTCARIADALAAAHDCGIIHRDLNPHNVMLASKGGVKVLDFGLARAANEPEPTQAPAPERPRTRTLLPTSQAGSVLGTPGYMSPEQIRCETVDKRTDVFAFGCLLYECLTGARAFEGDTAADLMAATLDRQPSWSALPRGVPRGLRDVLERCLEKRSDARPCDIRVLRREFHSSREQRVQEVLATSSTPNNLPEELTSFVGRGREMAACGSALRVNRIVTLTGIGGSGKTRLALKVAKSALDRFPNGVWFIDLAPLAEPSRVPYAVASVLGAVEEPGRPLESAIEARVRGKRVLIVLDNCEHVTEAVAALAWRLVAAVPGLTVLTTSREPLAVPGESVYAVQPLSTPPDSAVTDPQTVEASEAGHLFAQRARSADPGFRVTRQNCVAIGEICRSLDGIPLAIELAAARLRVVSVEELHEMLRDRFRLLTSDHPSNLRHGTLLAVIQWSYEHLCPEEQRLLRALSIFSGGWCLECASAVAGGGSDELDLLDMMTRLLDKSLLRVERTEGSKTRYQMLETVRRYAYDQLVAHEEMEGARERHLDVYLAFMNQARMELVGPQQKEWLMRIDLELENILLAHGWCDRAENGARKGLQLAIALWTYWDRRGLLERGIRFSREALERPGAERETDAHAYVLGVTGALAYASGNYQDARRYLGEGLERFRGTGNGKGMVRTLTWLGAALVAQGDGAGARAHYEEALVLAGRMGDPAQISKALNGLAELSRLYGELDVANLIYGTTLGLERTLGDSDGIVAGLLNLAMTEIKGGQCREAKGRLLEALGLIEEADLRMRGQVALDVAAALSATLGEPLRAARAWGASEAALKRMGKRREPADEHFFLLILARAKEEAGEEAFEAAENLGRLLAGREARAEMRAWLQAM